MATDHSSMYTDYLCLPLRLHCALSHFNRLEYHLYVYGVKQSSFYHPPVLMLLLTIEASQCSCVVLGCNMCACVFVCVLRFVSLFSQGKSFCLMRTTPTGQQSANSKQPISIVYSVSIGAKMMAHHMTCMSLISNKKRQAIAREWEEGA